MQKFIFLITLYLLSFTAVAVELKYIDLPESAGKKYILLSGKIEEGDTVKLVNLIAENPESFLLSDTIMLSSPGGSVEEALKLAKIIESSGLVAIVGPSDTCASACFLLFVSAQQRINLGKILVHRPYIPTESFSPDSHAKYLSLTERALLETRQYLLMKAIPSTLIDKMMSLPSSNAYQLTTQDSLDIGIMNPVVEEQAIRACGISNTSFLRNIKESLICTSGNVLVHLKIRFIYGILDSDRVAHAVQSAVRTMQNAENNELLNH